MTETKLGDIIDDSLIALDNYHLYRQDRNTRGGVVALFVHNSLTVTRLCSSTGHWRNQPGLPEYLFCEITPLNTQSIFVGVVYRPRRAPFITQSDFMLTYMRIAMYVIM